MSDSVSCRIVFQHRSYSAYSMRKEKSLIVLNLIVGLELRALGEYTAPSSILPILVGPQRHDSSFGPFPFDKLGLLSLEPSAMTNNRAAAILATLAQWELETMLYVMRFFVL